MIRLNLALLFVIPLNLIAQQKLEFIGENIDFNIDGNRFSINGIYYFVNGSDHEVWKTILFPFAQNTDSAVVKRVYNLTYSENLSYHPLNNAITFKMRILSRDTVMVNIAYSQKTVKENTYILESTQTWGQALKRANYSLTVDTSVQIDSLSLKPDGVNNHVYFWSKQDFYPTEDFIVWIR
ncbi:MAG TPA: hypothetical protein PKL52_08525 [Tenuifilaceae bacterium]|nr:hypothetical protein [Tenuifilaceae bacterium]